MGGTIQNLRKHEGGRGKSGDHAIGDVGIEGEGWKKSLYLVRMNMGWFSGGCEEEERLRKKREGGGGEKVAKRNGKDSGLRPLSF